MRETTKVYVGGKITRIVGGTSTIEAESIDIWTDNITFVSGGTTTFTAEKGINYGNYIPPEEVYTSHPRVEKVEFVDENGKALDQNTKDFYYGQKLKIRVTTKDTKDGEMIYLQLKAKSKSRNQKFDMMNGSGFRWGFVPIQENKYETPYFVLNPNWYSDDFEKYNYDIHQTEIEETDLNEFFVEVNLNAKDVYLPLKGQRLKPISYKRNYEELIGLFKTDDTGEKDLLENYENLYIDKYADENDDIKDIVDDFSEWLCEDNAEATVNEIEAKVIESAKKLWEYAIWQQKEHINTITTTNKETGEKKEEKQERKAVLDDRPLYWARIAMQVILKRQYVFIKDILTLPKDQQDLFFEKSIVPKSSKLWKIIQLFEELSRNYTGIDFSKANGKKKVLITGFDPFQLDPKYYGFSNNSVGPNTFNPAGIIALSLDDLNENYLIQTCIFPVRYEDFDNECIESVITKNINNVDLVITTSRNHDRAFDIEMFAIAYRGGFHDNNNIGNNSLQNDSSRFISNTSSDRTLTTLPQDKIFGSTLIFNTTINNQPIVFDTNSSNTEGSGSNYLSNEIMYRATYVRNNIGSKIPMGHFHLRNLPFEKASVFKDVILELINRIIL